MSTDIVPFHPPHERGSSIDLAPEAWKLASRVADTDFVPKGLRGKPEAVLACILAGHEAGLSPMISLRSIHVIEGRPAMSAEIMRAVVQRAGHDIWTEESSSTRVVLKGSRAGSERVSTVAWTLDDAKRANLTGKDNWRKYPRAMLLARATSELCRMLFPDVLAGISHTIEELTDGDDPDSPAPPEPVDVGEATTTPTTKAKARRAATAPDAAPAMEPEVVEAPRGEIPDLPGEDGSDIIDGEIVDDDTGATEPSTDSPSQVSAVAEFVDEADTEWPDADDPPNEEDPGPRLTGPQIIAIKLEKFGVQSRPDRLKAIGAILDREITSSKDLTSDEIQTVIAALEQIPTGTVLLAGQDDPAPAPQRPRRETVTPPEEWTSDRWREFLKSRKVKVAVALREAQRIGGEQSPPVTVGVLDDLAGSGICSELVGWVEEAGT